MDKSVGARMMKAALGLGEGIGEFDSFVSELDDGAEKKELVKAVGDIIRILTMDFVFRIARQHPEFDPDR
jgi:hypothetical protein